MAMKTFTSLFALLLFVLSASAETYNLSIWYETTNLRTDKLPNIHMFIDNNTHTTWPGPEMTWVKDTGTTKVYKWEGTLDFMPTNFIYSYNADQESASFVFVNGGYYMDGVYDHTEGKNGYTIYYDNSETSWWNNVYLYTWHNAININSGWTRYQMENIGNNLYKYHVSDEDFNNIIFNNGGELGSNQTVNVEGVVDGKVYIANGQIGHNDKYNVLAFDAFLTVTDDQDFSCSKGHAVVEATYTRPSTGFHWGTLCLPFEIQNTYDGVTFYQLSSVTETSMKFTPIGGTIAAGTPVAFKLTTPGTLTINESNVEVIADPTTAGISNWTMKGTFQRKTLSGIYFIYNDEYHYGTNITLKPYRGWFETTTANGAPFRIEIEEEQSLEFIEQEDGTVVATFDLQGRKLNNTQKGLVIENGKIIMIK